MRFLVVGLCVWLSACPLAAQVATPALSVATGTSSASVTLDPELKMLETGEVPEAVMMPIPEEDLGSIPSELSLPDGFEEDVASEAVPVEPESTEVKSSWPALEPFLIITSIQAKLEEDKEVVLDRIEGVLVIKEKRIKRRKFFRRWFLEDADGERVPLSSTLTFLEAVKQPGILDTNVVAEGTWLEAVGSEPRFFAVERLFTKDGSGPASGSQPLASGASDLATGPAGLASSAVDLATSSADLASPAVDLASGEVVLEPPPKSVASASLPAGGEVSPDEVPGPAADPQEIPAAVASAPASAASSLSR